MAKQVVLENKNPSLLSPTIDNAPVIWQKSAKYVALTMKARLIIIFFPGILTVIGNETLACVAGFPVPRPQFLAPERILPENEQERLQRRLSEKYQRGILGTILFRIRSPNLREMCGRS